MTDLQNRRSIRRARHLDDGEVAQLRCELELTRRALSELGSRVQSLPRYRFSFQVQLALADGFERLLRCLPERTYNWFTERHDDYRVRLGRPYRRRERREREALLERSSWAVTVYEFSELAQHYSDDALRGHPLEIDAELARIRSEHDSDFTP